MIENIKRIGLFMIAAQTVMHFAAGQQYEKYMRIITGVVVLLLFITPFSSYKGNAVDAWQKELEQITEKIENSGNMWTEGLSDMDYGSGRYVIHQLESEIKRKLKDETEPDGYEIADVTINWREEEGKDGTVQDMSVEKVRITLRTTAGEETVSDKTAEDPIVTEDSIMAEDPISIEKIQIGVQPGAREQEREDTKEAERMQEYRRIFAGVLEMEEEKVEVIYDGRG